MSNVQVAVRARPLSQRETEGGDRVVVQMRNKSTILSKMVSGLAVGETKDDSKEFVYDHSYWSVDEHDSHFVSQEQVYNDLGKSVLESAFQGYNACVFAYGQTGSGKTYTMMGNEDSPGLIPRICESLFAHTENGSKKNVSYKVEASYMEIYNEKVRDLLKGGSTPLKGQQLHNLKIREHPKEGPYVEDLSWHSVCDFDSISSLMKMGNSHRVTASTKMNDVSSRSHTIFTVVFSQAAYSSDLPCETVSKIHLVDLAGSERASATGAEGIRLKEGGNINRSLACLGNVISALADLSTSSRRSKEGDSKKPFIPYRDSVLTWLLKDSLGGNSKTIMVATISPAQENYGETLSTLRYASRAKNIVNKPVVNEDENVRLIRELRNEIKRLKAIIERAKLEDPDMLLEDSTLEQNIHKNEEMIAVLTKNWVGKWDENIKKAVEEHNLALRSEGIKMTLESERPYLLEMNNDGCKGVVTYHLKNGITTVGAQDASPEPDIALKDEDIKPRHCTITIEDKKDSKVRLILDEGGCLVNQNLATEDTDLSHGDLLQLGNATVFRLYHPEEARKLAGKSLMHRNPMYTFQPLSPVSSSMMPNSRIEEELVEQKEALMKNSNQEMEEIREELKKEREERKKEREENARVLQELDELKQQVMTTPTKMNDSQSEYGKDENDIRQNSSYDLMQSIVHTPFTSTLKKPNPLEKERDASLSPYNSTDPPNSEDDSPCSSPLKDQDIPTIVQDVVENDFLSIGILQVPDSLVPPHADDEKKGEEPVHSGAVLSTSRISSVIIQTCSTATVSADDSEVSEELTENQLREKEEKFQRSPQENREMEAKLTEEEGTTKGLQNHLTEHDIHHQGEQQTLQSNPQEEQSEKASRRGSNAITCSKRYA